MGLLDVLSPYASRPTSTEDDFDEVAPQVPADVMGDGIAHAFRSDRTPAFGDMVSRLFGGSNPSVRAGLLNQLIAVAGPAILAKFGSALGQRDGAAPATPTMISEADADRLSTEQVRDIAEQAKSSNAGVMDQIGSFYARHPEVVKVLGGAALAIALGRIANRTPR